MARKPNYTFEKRRKEEARKQRQEEKRARKREENARSDEGLAPSTPPGTSDSSPAASPE
jgi:hypothetical protein